MIYAVIAAGGIGSRMGNVEKPKQYLNIKGKPIIAHTVEKFFVNDAFRKIIILCPNQWVNYTKEILAKYLPENDKVLVIKGGDVTDLETPFIWLYVIGFIFILAFSIDWTDMGAVIYSPFSFINSFVDVLSYIRLFAVGLSGVYIAQSFNDMAMGLHSLNMPILTIPAAVLILGLGHLLNIVMAFMSVLVHGIRLNTLEFSGHLGLNWSGKAYNPLHSQEKGNQ